MISVMTNHWMLVAGCLGGAALFARKPKLPVSPETAEPSAEPLPKLSHPPGLYAVFETTMGRIVCRLLVKQAPATVKNFVDLARGSKKWHNAAEREWEQRPYYNGLTFHRVIPDFMIQGGDYMGNGTGSVGYTFEDEFAPDLSFDRPGLLAMANAGPNTNGAQFFITVSATPWLNQRHSIFGEVVEGQEVAEAISKTARDVRDRPLKAILMKQVLIVDTSAAREARDAQKID